jgi:hypothetical protein
MATSEQGFRDFLPRLTPTSTETAAARSHRASIEACLKSNFSISRFFRVGSFGNGTSIRGYSDVDYFASIPAETLPQNSDSALYKVWEALDTRFPNSGVGIRKPAIVVPFGTDGSESTDIVPAKLHSVEKNQLVYKIPDREGGWMNSSPEAHNDYVDGVNKKLSNNVKPLIRFIKAWKFFKNVPIYSFYLEMVVAKYAVNESVILYSWDVDAIFRRLWNNQLSALQDPMEITGYINPCFSEAKKKEALSKLVTAHVRAKNAREAESKGNTKEAFEWWDKLYGGHFPAYS